MYDANYQGPVTGNIQTVYDIELGRLHLASEDLKYLISLYQGEITFLDSQIGRLFDSLDDMGMAANTIVALTGDHGESFAEHADFEEAGNVFHPHSLYNAEQRTPLLIRFPGTIPPSTLVHAPSQAIDLFPTLLDLAGLPIPVQSQGTSLAGLVNGSDSGANRAAFSSMPDFVFTSITTQPWKLIQNNANGQRKLFDLGSDPQETTDVLAEQPDVSAMLTSRLKAWMKEVHIS